MNCFFQVFFEAFFKLVKGCFNAFYLQHVLSDSCRVMWRNLKHSKGALKQEKVDVISLDIARSLVPDTCLLPDDDSDSEDDDTDDYDVFVQEIGSDEDDEDSNDDEEQENEGEAVEEEEESISNLIHTTRSGRVCRTWKGRASAVDYS